MPESLRSESAPDATRPWSSMTCSDVMICSGTVTCSDILTCLDTGTCFGSVTAVTRPVACRPFPPHFCYLGQAHLTAGRRVMDPSFNQLQVPAGASAEYAAYPREAASQDMTFGDWVAHVAHVAHAAQGMKWRQATR